MNNKELKVGDKVRVVYKEGALIDSYNKTTKENSKLEFEYNNQIGEIKGDNGLSFVVEFDNIERKLIWKCLCEPVIKEKSNELLVDSIQENNIYLLLAKDNSSNGYVQKDKYYISKELNSFFDGYLINDIYYPISYFEKPTIIKETISTYIKDIKLSDLFTGKKSDNELSLPLIKKALFDIKWLENDDCEEIWKELQININKSLKEPLIEVKEEIKDEFVLPDNWYIKGCYELKLYCQKTNVLGYHKDFHYYNYKDPKNISSQSWEFTNSEHKDFKEITFEQFKKYVLKE